MTAVCSAQAKVALAISPKKAASKDNPLPTGLSNAYKISARVISHSDSTMKPAKPSR